MHDDLKQSEKNLYVFFIVAFFELSIPISATKIH